MMWFEENHLFTWVASREKYLQTCAMRIFRSSCACAKYHPGILNSIHKLCDIKRFWTFAVRIRPKTRSSPHVHTYEQRRSIPTQYCHMSRKKITISYTKSEDPGHTAHACSLIRAFPAAYRTMQYCRISSINSERPYRDAQVHSPIQPLAVWIWRSSDYSTGFKTERAHDVYTTLH